MASKSKILKHIQYCACGRALGEINENNSPESLKRHIEIRVGACSESENRAWAREAHKNRASWINWDPDVDFINLVMIAQNWRSMRDTKRTKFVERYSQKPKTRDASPPMGYWKYEPVTQEDPGWTGVFTLVTGDGDHVVEHMVISDDVRVEASEDGVELIVPFDMQDEEIPPKAWAVWRVMTGVRLYYALVGHQQFSARLPNLTGKLPEIKNWSDFFLGFWDKIQSVNYQEKARAVYEIQSYGLFDG